MIYLDNAATTKIDPEVLDAMMPYLQEKYGNPGGLYGFGRSAARAVEHARDQVAEFINAEHRQVIFTSGGSESNNLAIKPIALMQKHPIIISAGEHDSVLKSAEQLYDVFGIDYDYLSLNEYGSVEISEFRDKINLNTGLVSVMCMNNETGAVNPVGKIGEICFDYGIPFHTDCVQAAGCIKLDVEEFYCDFMSISSHKIHGPKGVGALYVRDAKLCDSLISGGRVQEYGLRGGTENVAGIVGFGKACELAGKNLEKNRIHIYKLRYAFISELVAALDSFGLRKIMHRNGASIGKTMNLRFDGIDAQTLILMLDSRGVCVSAGSACTSHDNVPSHVLLSMGISPDEARSSIRISFSRMNTVLEVKTAAVEIAECIKLIKQGV